MLLILSWLLGLAEQQIINTGCTAPCATCYTTSKNTDCASCITGYALVTSTRVCVVCPRVCTTCTSLTACTACITGYSVL
jgi:hypothetical protein